MQTLLDPRCHQRILARLRGLTPDSRAKWGKLTAPRMVTHLSDQMRHTLGDAPVTPTYGPLRWPVIKHLVMFWLPWPKGKIQGPREAFLTQPSEWRSDLVSLESLVGRFVGDTSRATWPDHPFFGRMTRGMWGRFIHRHFDHHLRQFGA